MIYRDAMQLYYIYIYNKHGGLIYHDAIYLYYTYIYIYQKQTRWIDSNPGVSWKETIYKRAHHFISMALPSKGLL